VNIVARRTGGVGRDPGLGVDRQEAVGVVAQARDGAAPQRRDGDHVAGRHERA
jgi:hypothetical protein